MSARIIESNVPIVHGTRYPAPFDLPCRQRQRARLADAAGLTQFGVNRLRLPPGCWSSQRHWHSAEDEFIFVLAGEVTLVTDQGEELLHAGDCAGFKAGVADGHQLQNRSAQDALILEIGSRRPGEDAVEYPGLDLQVQKGENRFSHRDGTCYDDTLIRR